MNQETPQSLRLEKSAVQAIFAQTRKVFVFIEDANITSSFSNKQCTLSSTPAVLPYIRDSHKVPVEHYEEITESIAKMIIPLKYDTIEG
jgi:hypothetical protein